MSTCDCVYYVYRTVRNQYNLLATRFDQEIAYASNNDNSLATTVLRLAQYMRYPHMALYDTWGKMVYRWQYMQIVYVNQHMYTMLIHAIPIPLNM